MDVIVYYRVAEHGGARSSLSLDRQQRAVEIWLDRWDAKVLDEFFELERLRMRDRPILEQALVRARRADAVLLLAMVGDQVNQVGFLKRLAYCGVDVRAADLDAFSGKLVPELLAIAEHRRRLVGRRIRLGLELARRQGRYGVPRCRLSEEAAEHGRRRGTSERSMAADRFARRLYPRIAGLLRAGCSLNGIARRFNEEAVPTATGRIGCWSAATVRNLVRRAERLGLKE